MLRVNALSIFSSMCHLQVCKVSKSEQRNSKVCESHTVSAQSHPRVCQANQKCDPKVCQATCNYKKPLETAQSHTQVCKATHKCAKPLTSLRSHLQLQGASIMWVAWWIVKIQKQQNSWCQFQKKVDHFLTSRLKQSNWQGCQTKFEVSFEIWNFAIFITFKYIVYKVVYQITKWKTKLLITWQIYEYKLDKKCLKKQLATRQCNEFARLPLHKKPIYF
jgi:hypothetical protein